MVRRVSGSIQHTPAWGLWSRRGYGSGNPVDTAEGLLCLNKDGESGAPSAEIWGALDTSGKWKVDSDGIGNSQSESPQSWLISKDLGYLARILAN